MAARLDIALQRNEDWARSLTITDAAGVAVDLAGMTLAMQVRDKLTQDLIASASVSVSHPEQGIANIVLKASEGSPLSEYGNPIQTANLPFDCRLTDADGISVVLFGGLVILSRGETVVE